MTKTNRASANLRTEKADPRTQCFCMGVGPRLSALMAGAAANSPVVEHFRTASIEVLKGFRAILDTQIEAMSRREAPKGSRVPVE